jgi:hypothetical protein
MRPCAPHATLLAACFLFACAKGGGIDAAAGAGGGHGGAAGGATTGGGRGGAGGTSVASSAVSSTTSLNIAAASTGASSANACDAYCNGCACPSDECTMCCAGHQKADVCQGGMCFCF